MAFLRGRLHWLCVPGVLALAACATAFGQEGNGAPQVAPPAGAGAEAGAAPAPAPEVTFELKGLVVEGNTVLSAEEIEAFVRSQVGRTVTVKDLEGIAGELARQYHSQGYVTTNVTLPPQEVQGGVVRQRVVEGRIGAIRVEGVQRLGFGHNYQPYLPAEGDLLNRDELLDGLNALNRHPDKKVRAVLQPGEAEGTTDVVLKVQEKNPLHFSIGVDNTGTENTPKHRATATVQYDNFFDRSQIGIVQFTTSPGNMDMIRQYAMTYYVPMEPIGGPLGHSILGYAAYSESQSDTVLNSVELHGSGTVLGMQYGFPLPDLFSFKQEVGIGPEWQKVEHGTDFAGNTIQEDIRKLLLMVRWNATRTTEDSVTALSMRLRYQHDGLLHFPGRDYEAVRSGAGEDFWSALFGIQRQQRLVGDWILVADINAQKTPDRLLPSEQYGLGGYDTVRGYRYRAITADEMVNARLELRAPVLPRFLPEACDEAIQPLVFYDVAWARNTRPREGELDHDDLSGAGVGMRVSMFDAALTGLVDAGWALEDIDVTNNRDEEGQMIIHFAVQYAY